MIAALLLAAGCGSSGGGGSETSQTARAAPAPASATSVPSGGTCAPLSADQQAVIAEVNRLRTDPNGYADVVAAYFAGLGPDKLFTTQSGQRLSMTEGRSAVTEAVAALRRASAVPALSASRCASAASLAFARTQGAAGQIGHRGADGSDATDRVSRAAGQRVLCGENISYGHDTPRDIVVQLVVDDGVPGRGHRRNLLDRKYREIGVGNAPHATFRYVSVHAMCL